MTPSPPPPAANRARRVWLGVGSALVLLVVVTVALLIPGNRGPVLHLGLDKVFHGLGFLAVVLPVALVLPRLAWAAAVAAALYGGAIELIQPSFGRGAEWADALANTTGAVTGALLGRLLHGWLFRPPGGRGTDPGAGDGPAGRARPDGFPRR